MSHNQSTIQERPLSFFFLVHRKETGIAQNSLKTLNEHCIQSTFLYNIHFVHCDSNYVVPLFSLFSFILKKKKNIKPRSDDFIYIQFFKIGKSKWFVQVQFHFFLEHSIQIAVLFQSISIYFHFSGSFKI